MAGASLTFTTLLRERAREGSASETNLRYLGSEWSHNKSAQRRFRSELTVMWVRKNAAALHDAERSDPDGEELVTLHQLGVTEAREAAARVVSAMVLLARGSSSESGSDEAPEYGNESDEEEGHLDDAVPLQRPPHMLRSPPPPPPAVHRVAPPVPASTKVSARASRGRARPRSRSGPRGKSKGGAKR